MRRLNPSTIHPPFANYAHGVEVPPREAGWCSVRASSASAADGAVPEGVEDQARLCFRAIAAILGEAGMSLSDVVRLNAYVSVGRIFGRLHEGP